MENSDESSNIQHDEDQSLEEGEREGKMTILKNLFNWHCSLVFKKKKVDFSKLLFAASNFWLRMIPNFGKKKKFCLVVNIISTQI